MIKEIEKIDILSLASYIAERYSKENDNKTIEEAKLHKLLYFAQRESYIRFCYPVFDADFLAWEFGPVSLDVHNAYQSGDIIRSESVKLTGDQKTIIDYVFAHYSKKEVWSLVRLTLGQECWKNARRNLPKSKKRPTNAIILKKDIAADAKYMRRRRDALRDLGYLTSES